jgi:tetratricopeptide (TPR) repeat protein
VADVVLRAIGAALAAISSGQSSAVPTNLLLAIMVAVAALCIVLLFVRMGSRDSDERLLAADPALSPAALRGYALALVDSQRFAEAEDAVRLHLSRMPGDTRLRGVLAALYSLRRDHASAVDELQRALQLAQHESDQLPAHARSYAALLALACAVELEALGDGAQAAARLREAVAFDPGVSTLRSSCMRLLAESARDSELERYTFEALSTWEPERIGARAFGFADATDAARFYRRASAAHPQDGRLLGDNAQSLQAMGDYQAAERAFQQAIQQSPRDASIHCDLGMFLWRRDRRIDALRELSEAIQLAPKSAAIRATLAMLLMQDGKLQDAEREFTAAFSLRPDVWILVGLLGNALQAQGKLPQAARAYQEAERLGASDFDFRLNYADLLLRLDQPQGAEQQYRLAIRADSQNGAAHARYGAFLFQQLRLADAEEQLRHALLLPDGEQAHVTLAGLCLMERRVDAALTHLKTAMEHGIQTPEVQEYQTEWMLLRGRAPEAYVNAQRLVDQGQSRASLYLLLGGSLLSMDRQLEAQAALREAGRVDPNLPATLLRRARALRERGALTAALEAVAQALAVSPDWPDAIAEQQALLKEQAATPAPSRRFTYRP